MSIRSVFINPQDGRLRAGWRILFFLVLYFCVSVLALIVTFALTGSELLFSNPRDLLLATMIGGIAAGVAVFLSRRAIDRKSVESLGLAPEGMWRDMLAGIGIGGVMVALLFTLMLAAGWLEFDGFAWQTVPFSVWALALLNLTLAFILTGISEEVMVRGYILQNMAEGLNVTWAVILSSALFALLHFGNPDGSQPPALTGIFLAGVFFAFAYFRTRSLWLAIGLHIGWNLFLNGIFGFVVSGADTPGLIRHTVTGPEIWTGGTFGPEAGLLLLPVLAAGAMLVYLYTRNR